MSASPSIDRLYQLPLSQFTEARNELAKQEPSKSAAAEIRALQKPSLPAWAVNQLFWKRRKVFDRLIDAAKRLRVEHGRQLSGKAAELEVAEARHREALKAASDEIRELLTAAGEQDTPATMVAVGETLQALLGRDDHGTLVKPLKPMGFEALAGLVGKGGATIARLQRAAPPVTPPRKSDAANAKRESQQQKKEIANAERALRRAEAEARSAKAEASRAEMTLARLQRERKELQERIDQITSRRDQASVAFDDLRRTAERAYAERERLAAVLQALKRQKD